MNYVIAGLDMQADLSVTQSIRTLSCKLSFA